jgi:hypothetical protein
MRAAWSRTGAVPGKLRAQAVQKFFARIAVCGEPVLDPHRPSLLRQPSGGS